MAGIVVVDPRSKPLPPLPNLMSVGSCSRELALTGESTIAYAAMSLSTAAGPITVTWHTPGGLPQTDCAEVICQPCAAVPMIVGLVVAGGSFKTNPVRGVLS